MYVIISIIMLFLLLFYIYKDQRRISDIDHLNKILNKLCNEVDELKSRVQILENLEHSTGHHAINSYPNFYHVRIEKLSYRYPLVYSRLFTRYLDTLDQVYETTQPVSDQFQNEKKLKSENIKQYVQEPLVMMHNRNAAQIFQELKASHIYKFIEFMKLWVTTGNIIVKIGMLILIATVISFLRYANIMGWVHIPIYLKLLTIVLVALGTLFFSWTKRKNKRSFSLVMQGGSIGIVLLTIFASVKMYGILSPLVGFFISLIVILLNVVLAVQQNTKLLAIMAISCGFLAPIWLSDGYGNHVVLFSYYAILNVGIFIIAILRPWQELNILGFIFTYVIGSVVGGLNYTPSKFATIEPFVILFFLFYLFIPLRYAQQAEKLKSYNKEEFYQKYKLNSGLLFGIPLVTLVAQISLLNASFYVFIFCLIICVVYGALAFILRNYKDEESMFGTLQSVYTWLSAIFLTLAVPIGLSAKAIVTIFALEGAGAVWLGVRANIQKRQTLTWLSGTFLQFSSSIAFFVAYSDDGYGLYSSHKAIINELYLSSILLSASLFLCMWFSYNAVRLDRLRDKKLVQKTNLKCDTNFQRSSVGTNRHLTVGYLLDNKCILLSNQFLIFASRLFFLSGISWWLGINLFEISRVMGYNNINIIYPWLIFNMLTASVLTIFYNHKLGYKDNLVWVVTLALIITGVPLALSQWISIVTFNKEVSLGLAVISWLLFAVIGWFIWRAYKHIINFSIDISIAIWFLVLATTVSTLTHQILPKSALIEKSGWCWGSLFLVWIIIVAIDVYKPSLFKFIAHRPAISSEITNIWQSIVSWTAVSVLGFVFIVLTFHEGTHGKWLPVMNSVDSLQILLLVLIVMWTVRHQIVMRPVIIYSLTALLVVSITYRMVNHWALAFLEMSDKNWFIIFGFWVVLALIIFLILNRKLEIFFRRHSSVLEMIQVLFNCIMFLLGVIWFVLLFQPGQISTWIPLFNPIDILQCSILLMLWFWSSGSLYQVELLNKNKRFVVLSGLILILITIMSLRFVYHLSHDITWNLSMFNQAIIQMDLTAVWSVLGVLGWVIGAKKRSQVIWLMSATLMIIVLAKLVVVDKSHLDELPGILSFLTYGFLCLVLGYFSPTPKIFIDNDLKQK